MTPPSSFEYARQWVEAADIYDRLNVLREEELKRQRPEWWVASKVYDLGPEMDDSD